MVQFKQYETKGGKKWLYRPYVLDEKTGKQKKTTRRGFRTKKEAEKDYAVLLLEEERHVKDGKVFFVYVSELWFDYYKLSGVKKSTIQSREFTHLPQLQRYFKKMEITKITPLLYEKFLLTLRRRGYKKGYIVAIHTVMKMIFNFAVKHHFLKQNNLVTVHVPKFQKTVEELKHNIEENYLTMGELTRFLNQAEKESSPIMNTLFTLLAYTGIRLGEALALEFTDFDYQKKEVHIYKTLYQKGNGTRHYEITTPKSEKSARKLQVSDLVIQKVKELQLYLQEKRECGRPQEKRHFCFVYVKPRFLGVPLTNEAVNREIRKVIQFSQINKKMSSHKFRHTHVSLLAQAGVSLPVIQERIGHGDKKVTEEVYLHVTSDLKVEAVDKLEELLQSKRGQERGQMKERIVKKE